MGNWKALVISERPGGVKLTEKTIIPVKANLGAAKGLAHVLLLLLMVKGEGGISASEQFFWFS